MGANNYELPKKELISALTCIATTLMRAHACCATRIGLRYRVIVKDKSHGELGLAATLIVLLPVSPALDVGAMHKLAMKPQAIKINY